MKELTMNDALKLQACLHKYGDNYVLMRAAVKKLGIERNETVITRKFFKLCLKVRWAMLNPRDKGGNGKLQEAITRTMDDPHVTRILWREFFARAEELDDVTGTSCRDDLEIKSGAGDWVKSSMFDELDDILAECRERSGHIRWQVRTTYRNSNNPEDVRNGAEIRFVIDCTWPEFFDYLSSYTGRGQWFRKPVPTEQGQMLVRMQEFNTSWPKCEHLMACPYRRPDLEAKLKELEDKLGV